MINDRRSERYAKLIIEQGINIKQGQMLVIRIGVEHTAFARLLKKTAYECGSGRVVIEYDDDASLNLDYRYAPEKELSTVRESEKQKLREEQAAGAALLHIISYDPDVMKGVDEGKAGRIRQARGLALHDLVQYQMKSEGAWCVAALPNPRWAKKVFPKLKEEEAMTALTDAIFHTVGLDQKGDAVKNWKKHGDVLREHCRILNEYAFDALHFYNGIGTDLMVPLVKNHIWGGGSEFASVTKQWFDPNIPTEEVFTAPHRMKTEGRVVASRPLNLSGTLVDGFSFDFHKGKVVSFRAKKGKTALETLLASDKGAVRLGEVALVPYDSRISDLHILFYDTLFDENAACHLALGASYPTTVKGGDALSEKELRALGMNVSSVHEDFMFGTEDLSADGISADGCVVPVFRKGRFVF